MVRQEHGGALCGEVRAERRCVFSGRSREAMFLVRLRRTSAVSDEAATERHCVKLRL